eukprot:GDKH01001014.1.p1 GENE.GDKH01001014.1~~GDKH01001014.1.p1  ORF type:complete len:310 (-),score=50.42 GDKH01001014.1:360-1289(-)
MRLSVLSCLLVGSALAVPRTVNLANDDAFLLVPGAEEMKAKLVQMAADDPDGMCHHGGHHVGHKLGMHLVAVNATASAAAVAIRGICGGRCQYGCFHGAIGEVIAADPSVASELCLAQTSELDAGECAHAAGHALVLVETDPRKAEQLCAEAFANMHMAYAYYCQGGLWMEHFGEKTGELAELIEPCKGAKNRAYCMYYGSRQGGPYAPIDAFHECGEGDTSCVFGSAVAMGFFADGQRDQLARYCEATKAGDDRALMACLDGVTARMNKYFSAEAPATCAAISSAALRERCLAKSTRPFYDIQRDIFW